MALTVICLLRALLGYFTKTLWMARNGLFGGGGGIQAEAYKKRVLRLAKDGRKNILREGRALHPNPRTLPALCPPVVLRISDSHSAIAHLPQTTASLGLRSPSTAYGVCLQS